MRYVNCVWEDLERTWGGEKGKSCCKIKWEEYRKVNLLYFRIC